MKPLIVETNTNKYPIYIESDFSCLKEAFFKAGLNGRKICVVTDSNTQELYFDKIYNILKDDFDVLNVSFQAGEKQKNLDTIQMFYKYFMENKMDRSSVVVALGGGVTGDMAGFAAASYMRGISFVQIPTTLLSQVDSSVGGKVGVDFYDAKNMIGAFYQPDFVYINTSTLSTLPQCEFSAGMAEVIKYGYIMDKDYLDYIDDNKESIFKLKNENIEEIIYNACKFKAYVVGEDEKEKGLRAILNFGHTFGHSIESLSGFSILHGEGVGLGMLAALKVSQKYGVSENEIEKLVNILEFFKLPIKIRGYNKDEIYRQMFFDKKKKGNSIKFVLLEKIGKAVITTEVTEDEIKSALDIIMEA